MKVVTICGSMKFAKEMQRIAGVLAIDKDWCVLQCVYDLDFANLTSEDLNSLKNEHLKRIELSDAIYIVNIDGYIGNSTKLEIEYATKLGKEVIYHEFNLVDQLDKYNSFNKDEKENVKKVLDFFANNTNCYDRSNLKGNFK